jgi:hypothetical protein
MRSRHVFKKFTVGIFNFRRTMLVNKVISKSAWSQSNRKNRNRKSGNGMSKLVEMNNNKKKISN